MKKIFLVAFTIVLSLSFLGCNRIGDKNALSDIKDNKNYENHKTDTTKGSILGNMKNEEIGTYNDDKFKFSVSYPLKWKTKVEPYIEATRERNATPDSGIVIYVENNEENRIYIFGQVSRITIPDIQSYLSERFTTTSGLSGYIYSKEECGKRKMTLSLNDGFLGAIISIDTKSYKNNEEIIIDILKSIKIIK